MRTAAGADALLFSVSVVCKKNLKAQEGDGEVQFHNKRKERA
jgi:hypothetical protein